MLVNGYTWNEWTNGTGSTQISSLLAIYLLTLVWMRNNCQACHRRLSTKLCILMPPLPVHCHKKSTLLLWKGNCMLYVTQPKSLMELRSHMLRHTDQPHPLLLMTMPLCLMPPPLMTKLPLLRLLVLLKPLSLLLLTMYPWLIPLCISIPVSPLVISPPSIKTLEPQTNAQILLTKACHPSMT